MTDPTTDYLFVYGTLRRDVGHAMHHVLRRYADYVDEAVFGGRLYDVGAYPAVVPSDAPADRVHGELYRLHEATRTRALHVLDRYEGCDGSPGAEYRRALGRITRRDGRTLTAWIYLYNADPAVLTQLPSGDYVAYLQGRTARF